MRAPWPNITIPSVTPEELRRLIATCPHCQATFPAVVIKNVRLVCPCCRGRYVFEPQGGQWVTEKR